MKTTVLMKVGNFELWLTSGDQISDLNHCLKPSFARPIHGLFNGALFLSIIVSEILARSVRIFRYLKI